MHSYKGRGGPSRSTPTNVQCQKCLKRGHYSYECKAAPQERPYVSRPSRTQQLLNPKLRPKLASEVPDPLQKRTGVADEELAKREAERLRKRQLDEEDTDDEDPHVAESKRQRSASSDSMSTRSASPPPRKYSPSPGPARSRVESRPAYDSDGETASTLSRSDATGSQERNARGPGAIRHDQARDERRRGPSTERDAPPGQIWRPSPAVTDDSSWARHDGRANQRLQSRSRSRSPRREMGRPQGDRDSSRRHRRRENDYSDTNEERGRQPPQQQQPRERSLSPFSRRLALTQAMNMGR